LLIGGLILTCQLSQYLRPEILRSVPEICPYRIREKGPEEEEEKSSEATILVSEQMISSILDVRIIAF
jgi:hypothetical protein